MTHEGIPIRSCLYASTAARVSFVNSFPLVACFCAEISTICLYHDGQYFEDATPPAIGLSYTQSLPSESVQRTNSQLRRQSFPGST